MDFIFAPPEQTEKDCLVQGDLLVRNAGLQSVLAQAHGYYATAPDYNYFLVLTQSCDLVRRPTKPKARYITLAAVRPLSLVIERFLEKIRHDYQFPIMLCQKDHEIRARQLLERLLHNVEDGFFFLKKDSHPTIDQDLCVFLPLSVAVRSDHYDACLEAKVAQLDHIFAAKVGWLTGNMYSRVATPDVEEIIDGADEFKEAFYREVLLDHTAWLSSHQLKELKTLVAAWKRDNPSASMDETLGRQLLEQVPSVKAIAVSRIVQLLTDAKILDKSTGQPNAVRNILMSDVFLGKLVNS
jgi:hypothetical protein